MSTHDAENLDNPVMQQDFTLLQGLEVRRTKEIPRTLIINIRRSFVAG